MSEVKTPDSEAIREFLSRSREETGNKKTYAIEVVTPMFGGGAQAGEVDESMPVRATEIRGHLRFWWRTLFGVNCENEESLFEKEKKIWGATDLVSPITISVKINADFSKKICGDFRNNRWTWNNGLPKYALFPFKPDRDEEKARIIPKKSYYLEGLSFTLSIEFPSQDEWKNNYQKELESTLWAWVNFGGLGARTRRGCGVLYCQDFSPEDADKFFDDCNKYLPRGFSKGSKIWNTIRKIIRIQYSDSIGETWLNIIKYYQSFRQGTDFARNPGSRDRPGRSRWPEAESIREITKQRNPKHYRLKDYPLDAFPRSVLGLPIITHFKNDSEDKKDPADSTLLPYFRGTLQTRMGSPLILKPLCLRDKKSALPLIILFNREEPEKLALEVGNKKTHDIRGGRNAIRNPKFSSYADSPLKGSPEGDAVAACIEYIKEEFRKKRSSHV